MKNCYGKVKSQFGDMVERLDYFLWFKHRIWIPKFKPNKYIRKLYHKQQRQQHKVVTDLS